MNSKPSKSAKKREYLALQELGERLIDLSPDQLGSIDLGEDLRDAIINAKSMRAHGALRRQKQLIGKLMRTADSTEIRTALEKFNSADRVSKQIFQQAETWRERLIDEGKPALNEFAEMAGSAAAGLEGTLSSYHGATSEKLQRTAKRQLFREIHRILLDSPLS